MNAPLSAAALKFADPDRTAKGEVRASVALTGLRTLWFNTGTLCNIECLRCYIESSPTNDRLVYLSAAEVAGVLDEAAAMAAPLEEVGFTGGEPFMNPDFLPMLSDALERGHPCLVLTNAMRPMQRPAAREGLAALVARHGERLTVRVSLDHHDPAKHDEERGEGAFAISMEGMRALRDMGARMAVAGRTLWHDDEAEMRAGYAALFAEEGFAIDAADPSRLVLFPEMDAAGDPPEITTACWGILGKSPDSVMCASARMVVKRKGAARPSVAACTLLPYAAEFDLGESLAEASRPVKLNHPHCATFCVLGGGSCSG